MLALVLVLHSCMLFCSMSWCCCGGILSLANDLQILCCRLLIVLNWEQINDCFSSGSVGLLITVTQLSYACLNIMCSDDSKGTIWVVCKSLNIALIIPSFLRFSQQKKLLNTLPFVQSTHWDKSMLTSVSVLISDVSLVLLEGEKFFFCKNLWTCLWSLVVGWVSPHYARKLHSFQPLSKLPAFCSTEVTSGSNPSILGEQYILF